MIIKSLTIFNNITIDFDVVRYYPNHFLLQTSKFVYQNRSFQVDFVIYEEKITIAVNEMIVLDNTSYHKWYSFGNKSYDTTDFNALVTLAVAKQLSGTMLEMIMNHKILLNDTHRFAWKFVEYIDTFIGSILGGMIVQRKLADNSGYQLYFMVKSDIVHQSPWQLTPFTHSDVGLFINNMASVEHFVYISNDDNEEDEDDDY
jgi:hypothetical protein